MSVLNIFAIIVLGFASLRLAVAIYNWCTNPVLKKTDIISSARISVLIPARNEEKNIGTILDSLLVQTLQPFEILVLNDQSTDDTASIVNAYCSKYNHIKLIQGSPLPQGWLGKNWACHQLSQQAGGDYFLFIDADVFLEQEAIASAVLQMQNRPVKLLSVFPYQQMKTAGELIVVPLMHYLLLSLLPLRFVYYFSSPSLAAANGQFMLFDAKTYRDYLFHSKVSNNVVEDVAIMRLIKSKGFKAEVLLSTGLISCRMYTTFSEGFSGFSKNLFPGFGKSIIGFQLYFLLIFWLWIPLFFLANSTTIVLFLIVAIAIRTCISALAKQNIFLNIFLHPLQILVYVALGFNSMRLHFAKKVIWKGRTI